VGLPYDGCVELAESNEKSHALFNQTISLKLALVRGVAIKIKS
jgi:hypothetical protein